MAAERASCGRGRFGPSDILYAIALRTNFFQHILHAFANEEPGAHIAWFFLAPYNVGIFEPSEVVGQRFLREGVELFDTHDEDVF